MLANTELYIREFVGASALCNNDIQQQVYLACKGLRSRQPISSKLTASHYSTPSESPVAVPAAFSMTVSG